MFFLLKKGFSKKHVITFKNKLSWHTKKVRPGIQFAEDPGPMVHQNFFD